MTGENVAQQRVEQIHEAFSSVPYARLLGIEIGAIEHGAATLHMKMRDELLQNRGVLHGGATASLIDTASAFAILTLLDEGESTTTVDLTVHYLRPVTEGRITARARVLRAGRRMITVSVEVTNDSEALIATALTAYLRLT
ncbi:MAG TPA: PaaI family thioesterase [Pyrinomonadaceae bacterium]|nr:PaaI family thioesterase [Pyrinomonadaceae bacterium]